MPDRCKAAVAQNCCDRLFRS